MKASVVVLVVVLVLGLVEDLVADLVEGLEEVPALDVDYSLMNNLAQQYFHFD